MTEKQYLTFFYGVLMVTSLVLSYGFGTMPEWAIVTLILVYGFVFFIAFSAIQSVAQNMVMGEVEAADFATILSVQNMPGLLFIGMYSLYLTLFRNGCPSTGEIFISVAAISFVFLVCHLRMHVNAGVLPAKEVTSAL